MNIGIACLARLLVQCLAAVLCLIAALGLSGCGGGSGSSEPPPPSYPLGDPVSQTVGPAGGTVHATTLGATVDLTFPAGALAADTAVTVTPMNPASGQLVSLKLQPAGVVFAQPVTLVLTYPPGKTPATSARLRMQIAGADVFLGTTVDAAARTIATTLTTFGGDTVQALGAARSRDRAQRAHPAASTPDSSGTLSATETSTIAQAVADANARLTNLSEAGLFEDALALELSIADLLQRSGESNYASDAVPFLNAAHDTACTARNAAFVAARTATLTDPGQFKPLFSAIMYWDAIVQGLGGALCPGDSDGSAANAAAHELALREFAFLSSRFPTATTGPEFAPPAADVKDGRTLKAQAATLQAAPASAPQAPDLSGMSSSLQGDLIGPAVAPARDAAWSAARNAGTEGAYPVLLDAFGPTPPLSQDVQYVRTGLRVASNDSSANLVGSVSLGFDVTPATPADPVRSGRVQSRPGGSIELSGTIATLECSSAGAETLQVTFEGVNVASASGSGGLLLSGALASLTPAGLLSAAGLPPDDTGTHALRVVRSSPCSAPLGIDSEEIGTVMLDFDVPALGFANYDGNAANANGIPPSAGGSGCEWASGSIDDTTAFENLSVSLSSPCGTYSVSFVPRLTDSRTLAIASDFHSVDGNAGFSWNFGVSTTAAGTVSFTPNPDWMTSATCGDMFSRWVWVEAWIQYFDPGIGRTRSVYAATSLCGIDLTGAQPAVTLPSPPGGTGYNVQFIVPALDRTYPGHVSMDGHGTVMTVHFDPTP